MQHRRAVRSILVLLLATVVGPHGGARAQSVARVATATGARAEVRPAGCPVPEAVGVHVVVSPQQPREGDTLRVLAGSL
ncbi:MAG: hypothetical protein IT379_10470, partial [Deltaproteobacteria bacterium]|nr:hypothetical protein [Deltaproteobacteria bacterium]